MYLDQSKILQLQLYFETAPVLKAYLFGSYSRGEATVSSDIDILLDLDYSDHIGLRFIQMKLDLEALLSVQIDLVSSNGISEFIQPYIESEKELIYERKN
ncbi:MAG: nucleotidyltransferase family protein [Bacteroidales bacterium]